VLRLLHQTEFSRSDIDLDQNPRGAILIEAPPAHRPAFPRGSGFRWPPAQVCGLVDPPETLGLRATRNGDLEATGPELRLGLRKR
jgi:hypothetical protein